MTIDNPEALKKAHDLMKKRGDEPVADVKMDPVFGNLSPEAQSLFTSECEKICDLLQKVAGPLVGQGIGKDEPQTAR